MKSFLSRLVCWVAGHQNPQQYLCGLEGRMGFKRFCWHCMSWVR